MALGKDNKNNNGNQLIFLRDVGSKKAVDFKGKDNVPYFEVTRKEGEEWKKVAKTDSFSGNLRAVSVGLKFDANTEKGKELIKKWKGNPYEVKVELEDNEAKETYVWKAGLSIGTRSLFNALLSVESPENLEISMFKDKKGYDKYVVRQNGTNLKWKYELTDIPAPTQTEFKGEVLRDYTAIDDFYAEKLKERFSNIQSEAKQEVEEKEEETDVPF